LVTLLMVVFAFQARAICTAGSPNANLAEATPTSDFVVNSGGYTVTHTKTGLMWKRCPERQGFIGNNCGDINPFYSLQQLSWADALKAATTENTNAFAGYTDWRLPNKKELESIVEYCGAYPAINQTMFLNMPVSATFWTSTSGFSADSARVVSFMLGVSFHYPKAGLLYVRLVRGGQVYDKLNPTRANSSTALATSGSPSVVGQSLTFTATVTGNAPSGHVTFNDGPTTLCASVQMYSGQASCSTSSLGLNSHSISAVYEGDSYNTGSTSPVITQIVNRASTTTTIPVHTPNPLWLGSSISITIAVAVNAPGVGTPTGTVLVTDGPASCVITLPVTTCSLTPNTAGINTLTASYSGDTLFAASTSPVASHTVYKASSTLLLSSSALSSLVGTPLTLTATVAGFSPTGTVGFYDGAGSIGGCTAVAIAATKASCVTSALALGTRNLTASYAGDLNNAGSTSAVLSQRILTPAQYKSRSLSAILMLLLD